jgi:hypothetical protein
MTGTQSSCEIKKQLFVSYCHADQRIIHRIADELTKLNYKIWIDTKDLTQENKLLANYQNAIENSHIVICFISKNYIQSDSCMVEITHAYNQKKKILPIMLDDYFKVEQEGIQLLLSRIKSFYAFKQPDTFSPWNNNHFERLQGTIFQLLSEICSICSNNIKNEKQGLNSMNSFLNDKNKPTGETQDTFEGI